ncbi:MAG: polyprenol monophosphomannose synthase [Desulfurococcaceae archaeon]
MIKQGMKTSQPRISIVVPTYNERENIGKLIELLAEYLKEHDYEIVVVDDNSPDGTAEVAESYSFKHPVKVVRRPGKMGLTSAIYDGVKNASGDVIVVMDADLQHPPSLVPRLVSKIQECDVVIASRYSKEGGIERWNLTRKLISLGAVLVTRLLVQECRGVKDPVSGFFAARREVISRWKPIVPEGYKALVEILSTAKPRRVCEEPYVFKGRSSGKSKLGSRVVLLHIKLLFKLHPSLVTAFTILVALLLSLLIWLCAKSIF